jgi:hypothetical protein
MLIKKNHDLSEIYHFIFAENKTKCENPQIKKHSIWFRTRADGPGHLGPPPSPVRGLPPARQATQGGQGQQGQGRGTPEKWVSEAEQRCNVVFIMYFSVLV